MNYFIANHWVQSASTSASGAHSDYTVVETVGASTHLLVNVTTTITATITTIADDEAYDC